MDSVFVSRPFRRTAGAVLCICAALLLTVVTDRGILGLLWMIRYCAGLDTNPQEFGPSMIYMTINGRGMILTGMWTTVRIDTTLMMFSY